MIAQTMIRPTSSGEARPQGIFISSTLPWGLDKDLHGGTLRALVMLQGCLDAWGCVDLVFLDRSRVVRSTQETEAFESWIRGRLAGEFTVQVISVPPHEPVWIPRRLLEYFLAWPLGAPKEKSLALLVDMLRRQTSGRIFCQRIEAFKLACSAAKAVGSKFEMVMDLDDIEHRAYARRLRETPNYPTRFLLHLHTLRYWLWEQIALSKCTRLFVCSDSDAALLMKRAPRSRVDVVANTIADPGRFPSLKSNESPPVLLFVGVLTYSPNLYGLRWFIDRVWPLVLQKQPSAKLKVAGKGSEHLHVPEDVRSSVELLGFVNDLTGLYRQATIAICPIRSGGGTRIKLIEACAHGLASVSTRLGAEGLLLAEGESILIRDEPDEFAHAVIELIEDRQKAEHIGWNARRAFEQHYERAAVIRHTADLLRSIPDQRVSSWPAA